MTTLAQAQSQVDTYIRANNRGLINGPVLHSILTTVIGALGSVVNQRTVVNDADYAASMIDGIVAYSALTTSRTVTLPLANTASGYIKMVIVDESGQCSASNYLHIQPSGTDLLRGVDSLARLQSPFASMTVECNNSNAWVVVARTLKPVLETLSGTADGSNSVFLASFAPLAGTLLPLPNGLATADFTVGGRTVTFGTPPAPGSNMLAYYLI